MNKTAAHDSGQPSLTLLLGLDGRRVPG